MRKHAEGDQLSGNINTTRYYNERGQHVVTVWSPRPDLVVLSVEYEFARYYPDCPKYRIWESVSRATNGYRACTPRSADLMAERLVDTLTRARRWQNRGVNRTRLIRRIQRLLPITLKR